MAQLTEYRAETGSGVIIKADGAQVGYAQGLQIQENYRAEQVYVIGTIMPQENVNHQFSARLSMDHVTMRLDEMLSQGIIKVAEDVIRKADFLIEVIDIASQLTKVSYEGCVLDSRSHTIRANQLSASQMVTLALNVTETV